MDVGMVKSTLVFQCRQCGLALSHGERVTQYGSEDAYIGGETSNSRVDLNEMVSRACYSCQ